MSISLLPDVGNQFTVRPATPSTMRLAFEKEHLMTDRKSLFLEHTSAKGLAAVASLMAVGLVGCGDDALPGTGGNSNCSADINASVSALTGSTDALVAAAGELKAEIGTACAQIVTDLGGTPPEIGDSPSDENVTMACDMATAAINASIEADGAVTIAIEGGSCEVAVDAQFSCEAECSVMGECDPGSVEVRCDPGELSVTCEGECMAGATCQGTAEVAAMCQGSCGGTCNGTCDGTCSAEGANGMCEGTCEGTCTGTCTGDCVLEANASVMCGAEARCKGGCDGTVSAPRCEGEVMPPSCDIEADCQAGCDAQASAMATCTPPMVTVSADGNADLVATLEANFPAVLNVGTRARLIADATGEVVTSFGTVTADIASAGVACGAAISASFAASAEAAGSAVGSVSVSASASVSVSGSAMGSTN